MMTLAITDNCLSQLVLTQDCKFTEAATEWPFIAKYRKGCRVISEGQSFISTNRSPSSRFRSRDALQLKILNGDKTFWQTVHNVFNNAILEYYL